MASTAVASCWRKPHSFVEVSRFHASSPSERPDSAFHNSSFVPCSSYLRGASGESHIFLSILTRRRSRDHPGPALRELFSFSAPFSDRQAGLRRRGFREPWPSPPDDTSSSQNEDEEEEQESGELEEESEEGSASNAGLGPGLPKKSRNQKKREARQAVQWGMAIAKFSPPQIKRILRAASLGADVYDAFMLVKRLGPDVREGRRRQFNYIGKLLREAEPELMDGLIQATKVGDSNKLQALAGFRSSAVEVVYEEEEDTEFHDECGEYIVTADRWLDGLISKDSSIMDEVYSIYHVDFDRQELRQLVRKLQSMRDRQSDEEKNGEQSPALIKAKKTLVRFLRALAKQSATSQQ